MDGHRDMSSRQFIPDFSLVDVSLSIHLTISTPHEVRGRARHGVGVVPVPAWGWLEEWARRLTNTSRRTPIRNCNSNAESSIQQVLTS